MTALKYDAPLFAFTILEQARRISEDVQDSFDIRPDPRRQVWFNAISLTPNRGRAPFGPWRIQVWKGDPFNADLLEEGTHRVRDICRSMEYLCSDIRRGIRVIDGGATLVVSNIEEAVDKQNPTCLTPETCDAILQMVVYGAIPHK